MKNIIVVTGGARFVGSNLIEKIFFFIFLIIIFNTFSNVQKRYISLQSLLFFYVAKN